jgi:hypothetical protein
MKKRTAQWNLMGYSGKKAKLANGGKWFFL